MQLEDTRLFRVSRGKGELSFDYILKVDNNWQEFKALYEKELRPVVIKEVEKMLLCRDPKGGFATYLCTCCGETKVIPLSCNSRLCSRCGKRYADIWAEELANHLLPCVHRHIVLTISDKLWCYFIDNPKLQKLLLDTAAKTMKEVLNLSNNQKRRLRCGEVLVLRPFGDDLKANFHVHILISEGGLDEEGKWNTTAYLDYETIRKKWQYNILTGLRREPSLRTDKKLAAIIDWCFRYRKNGFYIFAKRRLPPATNRKGTIRYIGRYVRHPAISNRRIIGYDGRTVTFIYEEGKKKFQKTLPKFEFIKAVLQHVTESQFKVVRRFGLYARRGSASYQAAYEVLTGGIVPEVATVSRSRFKWRENVKRYTGQDPLSCPRCGNEMELFQLTYPDGYGGYKTVGGYDWLFKRGALIDVLEETPQEIYA
jgi:hypothetical protein